MTLLRLNGQFLGVVVNWLAVTSPRVLGTPGLLALQLAPQQTGQSLALMRLEGSLSVIFIVLVDYQLLVGLVMLLRLVALQLLRENGVLHLVGDGVLAVRSRAGGAARLLLLLMMPHLGKNALIGRRQLGGCLREILQQRLLLGGRPAAIRVATTRALAPVLRMLLLDVSLHVAAQCESR